MRLTVVAMGAESLSLEALSAFLKEKGHRVTLAFDPSLFDDANYFHIPVLHRFLDDRKGLIRRIADSKPDLIGFSVFTDNFSWALTVARQLKSNLDVPIIFGGIYASACPENVIDQDCVDMVCAGEGEYPLLEILNNMQQKVTDYGVKNIWFKKPDRSVIKNPVRPLVDLDSLPFLDKALFENEINIQRMYMTMTARGCSFACSYCSHNFLAKFHGQRDTRRRSVDSVIQELCIMKKRYSFREVGFYDSILTVNKPWTLKLLERYKNEIKVPFRAISHPLCIDEDIASALKRAGCFRVQFGVQSFNEQTKCDVLYRPEKNEQILRSFDICDKVKLRYSCDHMFGLPGESEKEQILAAKMYRNFKNRVRITCFWTTYFPKTDLVDIAYSKGLLDKNDIAAINRGESPCYIAGSHGYLKNKEMLQIFKNYEILFRAMPILPSRIIDFIIKYRLQRFFRYMPRPIILFIVDFAVMIAKTDLSGFQYVDYYLLHIRKKISNRLSH